MRCTICLQGSLVVTQLSDGPPCYQCDVCQGKLLALSPYLAWVRTRHQLQDLFPSGRGAFEGEVSACDTRHAVCCPRCQGVMLRFHVLADRQHGLDFCFHCEEVWLDRGEWAYLKQHGLHMQIRRIATDAYQRQLRVQAANDAQRQRHQAIWGPEAFSQIEDFRLWLERQPGRERILRYLTVRH